MAIRSAAPAWPEAPARVARLHVSAKGLLAYCLYTTDSAGTHDPSDWLLTRCTGSRLTWASE